MTTAETVMERALDLAATEAPTDRLVTDLQDSCGGRRVSVVMARRILMERQQGDADERTARAVVLLDELLIRLADD